MKKIISIISILSLTGCSIIWKDTRTNYRSTCNPSVAPAVLDTMIAVTAAAVAVSTQTDIYDPYIKREEREIIATSATIGGIVYSISAVFGYVNSATCDTNE